MKNYVGALWLLFFSVLLNDIKGMLPGGLSSAASLAASVLGIIAIVKLSRRNRRLRKAKIYMIVSLVVTLATLLGLALLADAARFVAITGNVALLVLSALSTYHQLNGLADMAEEAREHIQAESLRGLFWRYVLLTVCTVVLVFVPILGPIIAAIWLVLAIYQLALYLRSIQIERTYESRIREMRARRRRRSAVPATRAD